MRLYEVAQSILITSFLFSIALTLVPVFFPNIIISAGSNFDNNYLTQVVQQMQSIEDTSAEMMFLKLFSFIKIVLFNLLTANYYMLSLLIPNQTVVLAFVTIAYFSYAFLLIRFFAPRLSI